MKIILQVFIIVILASSCQRSVDKEKATDEIYQTEKAFEKMTSEKGVTEAFYFYADENAVIHRENDTLIQGKEGIRNYYEKKNIDSAQVNWTPDFVSVSECGTMGYTYGKFEWKFKNPDGSTSGYKGTFHTVWKKQKDGEWKYVWD